MGGWILKRFLKVSALQGGVDLKESVELSINLGTWYRTGSTSTMLVNSVSIISTNFTKSNLKRVKTNLLLFVITWTFKISRLTIKLFFGY